MVASFDKAIPSGQEGEITLTINTVNKKGKLSESAIIYSNDPQKPKTDISITALVKRSISIEPDILIKLKGYSGEKISEEVTITSLEEQPLKITDISSTIDDKIKYDLKTIEKEKSFSLKVETRSSLREEFQGKIVLNTNSKKKPRIELSVRAMLKKEIKVAPQYLYFGIIDTGKETIDPQSLTRKVFVSRYRKGDLTIEKIEPSTDAITTEVINNKLEEKYTIAVTINKDKLSKGKFSEKLNIDLTFDKRSTVVNVIIEAKVI